MPNAVSRLTHTVTMQDLYYTVAWGVVMQLLKKGLYSDAPTAPGHQTLH